MTERDRRAVVLGSGVIIVAVLLLRVLPWTVRTELAAEAALRERAGLLVRARADLAEASALRDSAVALGGGLVAIAPKILSGSAATEAVADLAGRLNLVGSDHRAKLISVDPVADSAAAGRLHRVTVRAAFECDVRGLAGVLQGLDANKAVLTVRELRVTATDAAGLDQKPEVLRTEIVASGWFLVPADTRKKAETP